MQLKKSPVNTIAKHQQAAVAQPKRTPQAPPVYKPNPVQKVLQTKMSGQSLKTGSANNVRSPPVAPPVYRPQPVPKVLQTKTVQARETTLPLQPDRRAVIAPAPDNHRAPRVTQVIAGRPLQGNQTIQRVKAYHNRDADQWSILSNEEAAQYPQEEIMDTDEFESHQFEMFYNYLLSTKHDAFAEEWKDAVEEEREQREEMLAQGFVMQEEDDEVIGIEEDLPQHSPQHSPQHGQQGDPVGDHLRWGYQDREL
jgi:hypothetical protein